MRTVGQLILNGKTTTAKSTAQRANSDKATFHAYGLTSAGAGAATIKIQVSNKPTPTADADWIDAGTITLTLGTAQTGDGLSVAVPWQWYRANLSAISGTGATVSVGMAS